MQETQIRSLGGEDPLERGTRLLYPWDFPGRNTGVGSHSLLQGIFPTQGSNLGLPRCRQILYCLRHQRSPARLLPVSISIP